jgi:hypothetical protein
MLHSLLVSYFEQPVLPNGRARRSLRIEAIPGMGKTDIVHQAAESVRLPCVDLRLIQHETVDITGAIGIDYATKTADWYPFESMFPTDPNWNGVLFMDEFGQLDTSMQKIGMGILDKAGVAGRRIPKGARIVLASNRQQDRAGSTRLLTPIEARTLGVELLFSMDDWQAWAASNGIDQVVRSYATFVGASEFIPEFNPAEQVHAVPRTWASVSDELQARPGADPSTDNAEIRTVIQSLVGPGPVAQFMAFRQHFHLLHNVVDKVFDAPASVPLGGLETSAQHALIGAVAARVKERNGQLTTQQAENVGIFMERLPSTTLQTIMVLHCDKAGSQQWKASAGRRNWIAKHADVITSAMQGLAS